MDLSELKTSPTPPHAPFLGLRVAACRAEELFEWVAAEAAERVAPRRVGYLNAATSNLAARDAELRDRLESFDLLYADGKSVVWAARWLGHPVPERISMADFTEPMLRRCAERGVSVALVGGRPGEAVAFAEFHRARIEGLRIVFVHHGFFPDAERDSVRAGIEAADPDLVLLGLGSPLQEELASEWAGSGKPRVWWCVGALFEYDAGGRARAPVWMRRAGLEWMFRLALEPRRLWRRYLLGNPLFVARVIRERFRGAGR